MTRAGLVDVPGDRGAPYERHCIDVGVGQQGIDRFGVALHDVEHAIREPGLLHDLGQQE